VGKNLFYLAFCQDISVNFIFTVVFKVDTTCRYKSIESILKHGLDSKPVVVEEESALPQQHENVRGSEYYH